MMEEIIKTTVIPALFFVVLWFLGRKREEAIWKRIEGESIELRKANKELKEYVHRVIYNEFKEYRDAREEVVSCSVCGCLIKESDAIKKPNFSWLTTFPVISQTTTYYCKAHAPAEKKDSKPPKGKPAKTTRGAKQ